MEASSLAWLATCALAIVLLHVTEWRLYTAARTERDLLRERLTAVVGDRDQWRTVAERALLVAQMGARITTRAARVATTTSNVLDERT